MLYSNYSALSVNEYYCRFNKHVDNNILLVLKEVKIIIIQLKI